MRLSGGSGFGDPLDRDPTAIEEDVRQGYVSPDAAERLSRPLQAAG